MFIDKTKIFIKSGKGGDGSISFRREKYIPLGGPDGGDGGDGGSIIFEVDNNMTTLMDFKYKRKFVAENGQDGGGQKCFGKAGEDRLIKVPMGTIIREASTNKVIVDMSHKGQKIVLLKGGKGGKGNVRFATAIKQAPHYAEPGMPSEEMELTLELKLLADVGLLGFPNVGKSTFLSMTTKAKPKIANYHFTTLKPNLGVVQVSGIDPFVMADVPGIIEGAAEGVGLGIQFLKHLERTRLLIHIVDISGVEGRDPYEDFLKINDELKKYSVKLWDRPQIVVANKMDLVYEDGVFEEFKKKVNALGYDKVFEMSAATHKGVDEVMKEAASMLKNIPVKELEIPEEDMYVPEEKKFTYEIETEENEDNVKTYIVTGSFVDRLLSAVNVNDADSLRYFHKVLKNKGVFDELRELGIKDGDMVRLDDFEFEYIL